MPETSSAALHVDHVILGVHAATPGAALAAIAALLAESAVGVTVAAIYAGLAERERTAPTAWGHGIAVPHARIAGVGPSRIAFLRLAVPLDFGAPDGQPVDLLFAILSSQADPAEHIRLLSRLARRLREPQVVAALRGASDPAAAKAILESE